MRTLSLPRAPGTEVLVLENASAVALEGARRFVRLARETLAHQSRFSVALSGGSTPKAMHALLAHAPWRDQVDWTRVHVFWGDERFVPPDHSESSYLMAKQTLLDHVPLPATNIHPMPTVDCTPDQAAQRYTGVLKNFFAPKPPRFDLVFLGLGPDGHTASLFPSSPAPPEIALVSVVTQSPKPPPIRLTLTYRVFNAAAHVLFLAEGAGKAETLRLVFDPSVTHKFIPAKGVQPTQGTLTWILDEPAAAHIQDG